MMTQLPTSPDGLSLLELQSTLETFRSLAHERPVKLQVNWRKLQDCREQIWTQTATELRRNDPRNAEIADLAATGRKVIIALTTIAFILYVVVVIGGKSFALPTTIFAVLITLIIFRWLAKTWPRTTKLDLFLAAPPQFELIYRSPNGTVIAFVESLTFEKRNIGGLSNGYGVSFTLNGQQSVAIELQQNTLCSRWTLPLDKVAGYRTDVIIEQVRQLNRDGQIRQLAHEIFFLMELDDLIDTFQKAQNRRAIVEKSSVSKPLQAAPQNDPSRSNTNASMPVVVIADQLRDDLLRRLDRFVSGKMSGCPGLLLYGPSGTGKTSIARALSQTGHLELISVKLPDLKASAIGSGGERVRELWNRARAVQGKVLMFIDELDAIFPSRSSTEADVITREIVSAFCAEWDGVEQQVEARVFVLGATNRIEGVDPAIASRFGAQREIPLPDKGARKKIIELELTKIGAALNITETMLTQTAGMSGRDLHKAIDELAIACHPHEPNAARFFEMLDSWRADRSLERNEDATWDHLIVGDELKHSLQAYCRILKNYEEFRTKGITIPRGLLLYGPSGTGKTQIGRTLSREGGLSFIGCTTSDIKQGWIGHSAQKLREIFARARAQAPCILFIDELDTLAPTRGSYPDSICNEIVGELTQQMDGIRANGPAVFVVGATNRVDAIDPAILSRFVEQIEIGLPNRLAREQLLEIFLKGVECEQEDPGLYPRYFSRLTSGYSGRDLQQLVSKAILHAVKRAGGSTDFVLQESDIQLLLDVRAKDERPVWLQQGID